MVNCIYFAVGSEGEMRLDRILDLSDLHWDGYRYKISEPISRPHSKRYFPMQLSS